MRKPATQSPRVRSRLFVAAFAAAALTAGAAPAAALAGAETFMSSQSLSAGNAKASVAAHSGTLGVDAVGDHSFCPALARGYAGYTSSPNSGGNQTSASTNCGPGYRASSWSSGTFWHGAVWNQNISTSDYFSVATFYW